MTNQTMQSQSNTPPRAPRRLLAWLLMPMLLVLPGCDLELENPNAPTEEEVLTNPDGLVALAVALQSQFAESIRYFMLPSALVTDEWGPRSRALAADRSLFAGEPDPTFTIVEQPYDATYQIVRYANELLTSVPGAGLGEGLQRGILALAKLHKAMALGTVIQIFESAPVTPSLEGATPQPREVVMDTVLALLESARSDLEGVSDAELSTFRSRVLDPGIELHSTIDAMLARYYLLDGQYEQALDAAARVDPTAVSTYTYAGTDQNPLHQYAISLEYVAPLRSFALEAEPGDERVTFFADPTQVDTLVTPELIGVEQYGDRADPFPLYMPDEITLIRAEANAWLGNPGQARELVNQVRTDCEAGTVDPAPCLPALPPAELGTRAEILSQIVYERRYELFLTGLRWEDLRRLGEFTDAEPATDFLPVPQLECTTNPEITC